MDSHLMPPPLLSPLAAHVRRSTKACDACRRRKVRCNGMQKCQQCAHLDITCVYSPPSQRRSRKLAAPRGTVIAACRGDSSSPSDMLPPPPPLPIQPLLTPLNVPSPSPTFISDHSSPMSAFSPPRQPNFISRHLPASFFTDLIPEYETDVYPVNPIVTAAEYRACVSRMYTDSDALAFLYAAAALTINLSHVERVDARDRVASLLVSCFENRAPLSHVNSPPTVFRATTSIFLEICYMGLNKVDIAMMYLREAISQVELLGIHRLEEMARFDRNERSRRERLYWECFIHERFAAISFDRSVVLDPLPHLPDYDETMAYSIHYGWHYTIQTFTLIDRDFVAYWLRHRSPPSDWVRQKHRELEDDHWRIEVGSLSKMQQADMVITRQWLRTVLWQFAIGNMILSTSSASSPDPAEVDLSLTLPLQLSKELKTFLENFSLHEVGVHGSGMLVKLFEITNAITDVIVQLPDAPGEETKERLHDLLFLKKFMFSFPRIDRLHKKILEQKFARIRGLGRDGMDEGMDHLLGLL